MADLPGLPRSGAAALAVRMLAIALGVLVFGLPRPAAAQADRPCWEHYRDGTLAGHTARFPLEEYEAWVRQVYTVDGEMRFAVVHRGLPPIRDGMALSARIPYTDAFRPVTDVVREALEAFGGAEVAALFGRELRVEVPGFSGWVAVQNTLYGHLRKEARKGQEIVACLALIGRTAEGHLYLLNEFRAIPIGVLGQPQ